MKLRKLTSSLLLVAVVGSQVMAHPQVEKEELTIKGTFGDKFSIGMVLNSRQINGKDTKALSLIQKHFNSIVVDNCMKCGVIYPEERKYNFTEADAFVDFGMLNRMEIIGHYFVWHSQLAPWFSVDSKGK